MSEKEKVEKHVIDSVVEKVRDAGFVCDYGTEQCENYVQENNYNCSGCPSEQGCSRMLVVIRLANIMNDFVTEDNVDELASLLAVFTAKILTKKGDDENNG